jgi:hypothetical protein
MTPDPHKFTARLAMLGVVAILVVTVGTATNVRAADTDPTGVWLWPGNSPGDSTRTYELTLSRDGEKLTGSLFYYNGEFPRLGKSMRDRIRHNVTRPISDGTTKDDQISFKIVRSFNGRRNVSTYTAKIEGNRLVGKIGNSRTSAPWEAKRKEP